MEQIKLFIEKANTDSELLSKLDALGAKNAGADEVIALAAEYGFTFTAQEYEQAKARAHAKTGELSEEDLDAVSGGINLGITLNRYNLNGECKNRTIPDDNCYGYTGAIRCDHFRDGTIKSGNADVQYSYRRLKAVMQMSNILTLV